MIIVLFVTDISTETVALIWQIQVMKIGETLLWVLAQAMTDFVLMTMPLQLKVLWDNRSRLDLFRTIKVLQHI